MFKLYYSMGQIKCTNGKFGCGHLMSWNNSRIHMTALLWVLLLSYAFDADPHLVYQSLFV